MSFLEIIMMLNYLVKFYEFLTESGMIEKMDGLLDFLPMLF